MLAPRIRRFRNIFASALVPLLVLWLAPSAAVAGTPAWPFDWRPGWIPGDPVEAPVSDLWTATSSPGLFVAIDPTTHRPVAPSAEQRAAFQRAIDLTELLTPAAPVRVEALPHGGKIAHLNGAFQSFSIARRDASGRFVTDCAPDVPTALQLLATPVTVPPKEAR
jgi:hypothetical protein